MLGAPLELHEREEIFRALIEDPEMSWAEMARRVGRHRTTIAGEVARGGGRHCYGPGTSQRRAELARRRPRRRRLEVPGPLRDRIGDELRPGALPGGDLGGPGS